MFIVKMNHLKCSLVNGQRRVELETSCLQLPRLVGIFSNSKDDYLTLFSQYSSNFKRHDESTAQKVLYNGNSAKSLHVSVEQSLKKLRTSYIDLLYLHWWDWDTSVEEVMRALHTLVLQGKVLYLVSFIFHHDYCYHPPHNKWFYNMQGISDTPAWVVSKANQYARDHAMTPFVIYQGAWNVMERSFEREIIPMARSEGNFNFYHVNFEDKNYLMLKKIQAWLSLLGMSSPVVK